MADNEYLWRSEAGPTATARLEQLERFLDPATYRVLTRLGIPRGGRCWELGAGRGTTALFMLAHCGLGEVVATDIDVQWLDQIHHPCLRVVRHDVLVDDLEPLGRFDLIHVRLVIHHLGIERGAMAVRRAASRLNPGGVLFVEEPVAVNRAGRNHAHGAAFESLVAEMAGFSTTYGLDLDCGLQLPWLLRTVGLVGVDSELSGSVTSGGDPFRTWQRTTYELSKDSLPFDTIFDGRTDEFLRHNADPTLDHVSWIVAGAWGRAPT